MANTEQVLTIYLDQVVKFAQAGAEHARQGAAEAKDEGSATDGTLGSAWVVKNVIEIAAWDVRELVNNQLILPKSNPRKIINDVSAEAAVIASSVADSALYEVGRGVAVRATEAISELSEMLESTPVELSSITDPFRAMSLLAESSRSALMIAHMKVVLQDMIVVTGIGLNRLAGHSWASIASILDTSPQALQQRHGSLDLVALLDGFIDMKVRPPEVFDRDDTDLPPSLE